MSLFWSVIPIEEIFSFDSKSDAPTAWYTVGGVTMSLADAGEGMAKIERIISSNPTDYLRAQWQPGQLIPYTQSRKI